MYSVFSELGTLGCWKNRTTLQYYTKLLKSGQALMALLEAK